MPMTQAEAAYYRQIGDLIAIARQDRRLTQRQLASRLGVGRRSLQCLEYGQTRVQVFQLEQLAACLQVSPIAFLPEKAQWHCASPALTVDSPPYGAGA